MLVEAAKEFAKDKVDKTIDLAREEYQLTKYDSREPDEYDYLNTKEEILSQLGL